ncbi:hypothetical protein IP88_09660 [alpha proteobacterium AAP81b]|nr:hypothetical protein IP88_09660 [alpha proteobacterium AAP81b]
MELTIALETVCRLILRLREAEALVVDADDDADADGDIDAIDDEGDNPAEEEIRAIVDDMGDDEQAEVIALALVGRGTYEATEWADALDAAVDEADDAAEWMLAQPTLSIDLEAGLAAFDLSCDGLGTVV